MLRSRLGEIRSEISQGLSAQEIASTDQRARFGGPALMATANVIDSVSGPCITGIIRFHPQLLELMHGLVGQPMLFSPSYKFHIQLRYFARLAVFVRFHLNPTTGDIGPMRLSWKKALITLAASSIALPLWAAHIDTTDWSPSQSMSIGTTQLQPGQYQLRAEEGKLELQVVQRGKIVATIPCQWIQLPSKASTSQVLTDAGKVTQVQFGGHTGAIQFNQ